MPAVSHRGSGSRRRTINEINMVPFIDVMLVLLIIFMVTAPMITTGLVDVPSVGKGAQRPQHVVEITIGTDDKVRLRIDGKDGEPVALRDVAARARELQAGNADTPVVIAADRNVKYESVVGLMDKLQRAGVVKVGLVVKTGAP